MFKKILVAHRGEIACRIMRTAQKMGIKTVAVYSEADKNAVHVRMAHEAVALGASPPKESYLQGQKIIDAMRTTKAEAVHPGYGFLSENADFARAVEKAGFTFIGPPPQAIESMGDKVRSKQIASKAGVNTIPGHEGIIKDDAHGQRVAKDIGYPVMVKASAGGGGKGMRLVHKPEDLKNSMERAKNEARTSFGDDRIFIEKFITNPRHIEIQVIGDTHGHIVYIGERECSIQRRHQKVIEEAPSPFVDETMRKKMGAQAIALAQAVGYFSAGTVEFVVGDDKNFYFLEMNTRLQVEHPVSELTTNIDLVETMLHVAAGESLPFTQEDIHIQGSAIECRLYAEDSTRGFLPSIGRLRYYQEPITTASEHYKVRIDSGVEAGSSITMFYDPMIAKLCSFAPTRAEAIQRMCLALDQYVIEGVAHNVPFLSRIMRDPIFQEGQATTHYIDDNFSDGYREEPPDESRSFSFVIAAVYLRYCYALREASIDGHMPGHQRVAPQHWFALDGHNKYEAWVASSKKNFTSYVRLRGRIYRLQSAWQIGQRSLHIDIDGKDYAFYVRCYGNDRFVLSSSGYRVDMHVVSSNVASLYDYMPVKEEEDLSSMLLAPMPGLLISLAVKEGDAVHAGQQLAVIEAMKMENVLSATKAAVVSSIDVSIGDSLDVDQPILRFAERKETS
ncbi:MAG: acetyl/propionyl/methylcrotonyl-CoA carboxylase subunit alpha [Alphaproteobacteria bacterium GM7ARS4]|nr:acetyl/propionyl/methylcrotonyl-CoA carboxylase subunit alpha [Alphaproteobacteria bacterium GM7ARS4]